MPRTLWDPFTTLARLEPEFDEIVRSAFAPRGASPAARSGFVPAVEVVSRGEDVVVRFELPGCDIERDVEIQVTQGRLVVQGERRDERDEEHTVLLRELRYGSFRREFALPDGIRPQDVEATYDQGILDVTVRGIRREPPVHKVTAAPRSRVSGAESMTTISGETAEDTTA